MLCANIGYHPTACMTQQATKNETSAKTLANLFQMKKNVENMSILGREFVPVGNANKFNLSSHSFPFIGTTMFPQFFKRWQLVKVANMLVLIEEMRPASIHRYHGTQWATHNLQLKIVLQLVFFSIYSLISSSVLQEGQWVKHQWKIIFQIWCLLSFITCMSKIQLRKYLIRQLCSNFKLAKFYSTWLSSIKLGYFH